MKRNTVILLLVAAALGVAVYFLEIRDGKPRDEEPETSSPAFSFARDDIAGITLQRGSESINLVERDGKWVIAQPVSAAADESAVNSLLSSLMSARIERAFAAPAEDLSSYGLAEPALTLEILLKDGEQHRLRLGSKDYSGLSVYAQKADDGEVVMLGSSVLTSADKSLNDLRDRSVFNASQFEISSLRLINENGQISLAKDGANWSIKTPLEADAEQSEVTSLLNALTSEKVEEFVDESGEDPGKYGLTKPLITVAVQLQSGGEEVLTVGSKEEEGYYAKNSTRPQIFTVGTTLFDRLNLKLSDLRDKQILNINKDDLSKIEVKNPNLRLIAEKNEEGDWIVREPADQKDKKANADKIFDALEEDAEEIVDRPAAAVSARLARPAVEVRLTARDGRTTEVSLSAADGDTVYARVKGQAGVFKVGKDTLDELSFKAADIIVN